MGKGAPLPLGAVSQGKQATERRLAWVKRADYSGLEKRGLRWRAESFPQVGPRAYTAKGSRCTRKEQLRERV